MSAVMQNEAMRNAQIAHDSRCDCCGSEPEDRSDEYRAALKADPSFIAEAIGDGCEIIGAAYREGDQQAVMDAIADAVDDYLAAMEKVTRGRSDETVLQAICRLYGVPQP